MQRIDGHAQTPLQLARVDDACSADFWGRPWFAEVNQNRDE